jgi:PhzF family phenazine biosynthesis protein
MTHKIPIHQVDAFTRERFTGNPAGVVLDADGLNDTQMLAIARELNNADTAFLFAPDGPDHDVRVRFFTPRTEAGFVGHATIAAHHVLSMRPNAPVRMRQKSKAGIVEVEVRGRGPESRIAIRQNPAPLGRELSSRERLAVLDALALASDDLDPRCPLRVAGAASTRLLIGVRGPGPLSQLKPDISRLTTLSAQIGAAGYFVFALQPPGTEPLTEARMFCPALGIGEDPVSGNAHGLLGVYLVQHGLLAHDRHKAAFTGVQGRWLHRPGRVEIEIEMNGGVVSAVWIIGQAVSVFETAMTFD